MKVGSFLEGIFTSFKTIFLFNRFLKIVLVEFTLEEKFSKKIQKILVLKAQFIFYSFLMCHFD